MIRKSFLQIFTNVLNSVVFQIVKCLPDHGDAGKESYELWKIFRKPGRLLKRLKIREYKKPSWFEWKTSAKTG